jgi:SAM-dependent methyltransferase
MNIEELWNNYHGVKNKSALSGCGYDETIDFLQVRPYCIPGNHALEIGVGLGYVTKGFKDNGLMVSALEISKVGLDRVKNYCEFLFTPADLEKIPSNYFDCIICHNVMQHVPTDMLVNELKHCIRSLKPGGVFAIEFVSMIGIPGDSWNSSYVYAGSGLPGFYREPKYFEEMINILGGNCKMVVDNRYENGIKGCHVFHITRTY